MKCDNDVAVHESKGLLPPPPLRMIDVKALIHVPMECAMAS